MKTLIEQYSITLNDLNNLNENEKRIFESLKEQFEVKQELSDKQNDLLTKILKRKFDISNIDYKKYNLYREFFFRIDINGDYLLDSEFKISSEELDLSEQIDDLHAAQYNYEQTVNKYSFVDTIKVPSSIKNLNNYKNYFQDFEKLIIKFPRARTTNSKYNIIKAIKTILNEEYNTDIINNVLRYKHWN